MKKLELAYYWNCTKLCFADKSYILVSRGRQKHGRNLKECMLHSIKFDITTDDILNIEK